MAYMHRRVELALACVLSTGALAVVPLPAARAAGAQTPPANPDTWQIPANAAQETNPVPAGPDALKKGRSLYSSKCQRCHGSAGRGDGPDADPDFRPGDLTDESRASRNPDGVLFYKIWNGRQNPRMPAFKSEMTRPEVWTLIHYVKSLRGSGA
jgi:mono/diheme cytochrome c family protein